MSPHIIKLRKTVWLAVIWLLVALMQPFNAKSVVIVHVNPRQPEHTISKDFSGLSFEMQYVLADTNGNHFFSPANRPLIATFKQLGIKSLRVGGNTADRLSIPVPNETDADSLFAFAKAAGVKVIYTLRLNGGNRDAATRIANYIMHHYRKQLACFAIGNEPNVFSKTYAPYLAEWKKYVAEITTPTNSPKARFCGPSTSPGHESWAADFANEFGNHGPLAFIAQHDYPGGDARRATNVVAARDKILSPAIDEHYARFAAHFVPTILSNGLPYRLEEANSFYDGGAFNVSDTFASALWALDYQWWWAEHGASGINFHTGDKVAARDMNKPCRYAVFWTAPDGYNVHPIGYAVKMFSLTAHGRLVPVVLTNTNKLNIRAYAVIQGSGKECLTLINREHGASGRMAKLEIDPGFKTKHAQVMLLTAPDGNVAAKTGITLGGEEIHDNAKWSGKWVPLSLMTKSDKIHFQLPPATAAVVKFSN